MKLRIIRVDLPLKHVFTTSRNSFSVVRTIIVELEQDGLRGHGEAYEDIYYGAEIEQMIERIEASREKIEPYALADPTAFWRHLAPTLEKNSFARNAVDCAACDLWGKMKNKPLWKAWGLSLDNLPLSSYSIGLDSLVRIEERFDEMPDWPIYRIKLGDPLDMDILKMLRGKTLSPFQVDMNGGWDVDTAIKRIPDLVDLGVVLIEQPLPADDFEGMEKLKKMMKKKQIEIPIFADESWKTEEDLDRCVGLFDGINIKLVKCGGLTPARQLIAKAKHLGFKLSSSNSIESTVGVSAVAQLAPMLDYIAVDGPLLIEKKVGTGVSLERGKLIYPKENGTGVKVSFR